MIQHPTLFRPAPAGRLVRLMTFIGVGVLGMAAVIGATLLGLGLVFWGVFAIALALLVLAMAWVGRVKPYAVDRNALVIRTGFVRLRVPLSTITAVRPDPEVLRRALRLWGNGGLFAVTGLFRCQGHGMVRVFVTDPAKAVVLIRDGQRALVISPEDVPGFLARMEREHPATDRDQSVTAGG